MFFCCSTRPSLGQIHCKKNDEGPATPNDGQNVPSMALAKVVPSMALAKVVPCHELPCHELEERRIENEEDYRGYTDRAYESAYVSPYLTTYFVGWCLVLCIYLTFSDVLFYPFSSHYVLVIEFFLPLVIIFVIRARVA